MFNIAAFPPLIISGALLIICIVLFWMWISNRQTKRRLRRLEERK